MPSFIAKPPSPVLNQAHPLSSHIEAAWPYVDAGATVRDMVSGQDGQLRYSANWASYGVGAGVHFNDGSNDRIDASIGDLGNNFTVGVLVRPTTNNPIGFAPIICHGRFGGPRIFKLLIQDDDSGNLRAQVGDGNENSISAGSFAYSSGAIYMLHATYDGSALRFFVDGEINGESAGSMTTYATSEFFMGGGIQAPSGDERTFDCTIFGCWAWRRALTAVDISQHASDPFVLHRPPTVISLYGAAVAGGAGGGGLTADDLVATSTLGTPSLGQVHALTADKLTAASVVGTPALGQQHELTADAVAAITTLGTPALGQVHDLAADGLTATSTVGSPALEEDEQSTTDDLTASKLTTSSTVGTPALGQVHALTADAITAASVVGSPSIGQIHGLAADGLAATSTLASPAVGQVHVLTADKLITASTLDTPTLTDQPLPERLTVCAERWIEPLVEAGSAVELVVDATSEAEPMVTAQSAIERCD